MDKRKAILLLNLQDSFTESDLKSSWRFNARRYHPDITGGIEEPFKEINKAYNFLSEYLKNNKLREDYYFKESTKENYSTYNYSVKNTDVYFSSSEKNLLLFTAIASSISLIFITSQMLEAYYLQQLWYDISLKIGSISVSCLLTKKVASTL